MLTRSLVATAVTVVALSPFAVQQAFAAGAGELPREAPSPSAPPATTEPMAGMNHDMPGMNHDMAGMNHDMAGMDGAEMPGMEHRSHPSEHPDTTPGPERHATGHSHSDAEPAAAPRPAAPLIGVFAAVNAGVMGSALVLRRRDRSASRRSRTRAPRQLSQDSEVK